MKTTERTATSLPETSAVRTRDVEALRRDDFDRDVWCLLGLPVDVMEIDAALAAIDSAVRSRRKLRFITPNVNYLVRSLNDDATRRALVDCDLSLIDGAPLVLLAKMLGVPARARVAGADLFEALRRRPGFGGRRIKVFFFGGRDGAGEAAAAAVNREPGGVEAVGHLNPGFGDVASMSTDAIIDEINAAAPDFVLVAMGAAKGDAWIEANKSRLSAPVVSHLGAVIDFTGGGVARAPGWLQRAGLEWIWRIKEEPGLWRRYFDDAIALGKIGFSTLAPQLVRARTIASAGGGAEIEPQAARTVIRLSGALGHGNLRPVRDAFRAAAARAKPVCLDFTGLAAVDRAFLGQVLMLEKHAARAGCAISVAGASAAQRALLRANNLNYAAEAADPVPQDVVPARRAAS